MYYLFIVDHRSMAVHLTGSDCEGWMGLMMIRCGMAVKRLGMLEVSVRKMQALTVKMGTVILIGKGS